MLAHYLIYGFVFIVIGIILWKLFLRDLIYSYFPKEKETEVPIKEEVDALRARIQDKKAELAQLEADTTSLGEEVGVTQQISDKREELGALSEKLASLEEAMPENPLNKDNM